MKNRSLFYAICVAFMSLNAGALSAQYIFTDFVGPGGNNFTPYGISTTGGIVGIAYNHTTGIPAYGTIYNGNFYTDIPANPSATGGGPYPYGISGNNVVGYYYGSSATHGFRYDGSTYTNIDHPLGINGTEAYGVSGNTIVGYYRGADTTSMGAHGFSYNGISYTTIDNPLATAQGYGGGTYLRGVSGNNVVGYYHGSTGHAVGFLYDGTNFINIGLLCRNHIDCKFQMS